MKLQMDPPCKAEDHLFHHKILKQQNSQMVSQQNTECKHACTWQHDLPNTRKKCKVFS
jgi:hypothetical protein